MALSPAAVPAHRARKPFYATLYFQVIVGIVLAIILGIVAPKTAEAMKPLGDGFIKLIKAVIGLVIFFTVVSGIAGMRSMKEVGRIGGKALLYFEVVSTLALLLGLVVGNVFQPGAGFNVDPAKLNAASVQTYVGRAKDQTIEGFLLDIIPNSVVDSFARGDILPIVLVSLLVGYALAVLGDRARLVRELFDAGSKVIFAVINVIMRLAPIGAFGAMAFTVGRYGISSLGNLAWLVALFYITAAIFVVVVLGAIGAWAGFNIFKLVRYLREEILIVLGTSSSDPALPTLMEKLERAGCAKPVVGLVVPTGYIFNTDGTSIYMTLAALFVAQATNTPLTFVDQLAIFGVAVLTSKGASGVTGAGFIALVGTLSAVPTIPVAGMALILGVDRFMSEVRALVNMFGNAVATIVMAKWEGELDTERLRLALDGRIATEIAPDEDPEAMPALVRAAE